VTFEQIWAPWRLAYVQGPKETLPSAAAHLRFLPEADPLCFLCQAAVDGGSPERHVVHVGPHTVTMLNRYPYNNGHLLVAPRRHVARLDQLTPEEQIEMLEQISQMINHLETAIHPHGFNVGLNLGQAAGAGLPSHLHWHIVPRWTGDTNFMPVLANLNVIPQSLDAIWEALRNLIEKPGEGK
jgi:ATP adenylyltransferase